MPRYSFTLDRFQIDNTRAWDEDTDFVSFSLNVDGTKLGILIKDMGDVDNGDHVVDLKFDSVWVPDDETPVLFNYFILNSGHKNHEEVHKGLEKASEEAFKAIPGVGWAVAPLGKWLFGKLIDIIDADCDGPVAADQVSVSGSTLYDWTKERYHQIFGVRWEGHTERRFYPGTDSPWGCGSNSRYWVEWTVKRVWPKKSSLLWYKHLGLEDGAENWVDWNARNAYPWDWSFRRPFGGQNGIIYSTDGDALFWNKHLGVQDGSQNWVQGNPGEDIPNYWRQVGSGWGFKFLFGGFYGLVYGIAANGDLFWYMHQGFEDGTANWVDNNGRKIGSGWGDFKRVFGGHNGVIYALAQNGDLFWYKHLGLLDGSDSWVDTNGRKIGSGWSSFKHVFGGQNGIIYAVAQNGDLFWYKHLGFEDGSNNWVDNNGRKIGSGWNFDRVFGGVEGVIYAASEEF